MRNLMLKQRHRPALIGNVSYYWHCATLYISNKYYFKHFQVQFIQYAWIYYT
jgi:hypothetical protein